MRCASDGSDRLCHESGHSDLQSNHHSKYSIHMHPCRNYRNSLHSHRSQDHSNLLNMYGSKLHQQIHGNGDIHNLVLQIHRRKHSNPSSSYVSGVRKSHIRTHLGHDSVLHMNDDSRHSNLVALLHMSANNHIHRTQCYIYSILN